MNEKRILGVYVKDRTHDAAKLQSILTKYGCNIRTRLGLHQASDETSDSTGLLILELSGKAKECKALENELLSLKGTEVKKMIFRK
jgi:hypothetical protein